jgi:acyl-coenzyme A thioesterase PaaI-like protein
MRVVKDDDAGHGAARAAIGCARCRAFVAFGMAKIQRSPYARIRDLWLRLSPLPGGKWLFSRLVGWSAPYTRTIGATVVELSPGCAKVVMRDRWAVRNHLRSIHAIALMNMGELTTGLALTFGLPDDARGIPTRLTIEFVKKARGRLTSECSAPPVDLATERDYDVEAVIKDPAGDVVARCTARWRIGRMSAVAK